MIEGRSAVAPAVARPFIRKGSAGAMTPARVIAFPDPASPTSVPARPVHG